MELLLFIILFSLIGGIASTIGGVILLYKEEVTKRFSIHFISFAAGTLLAAAFFDLLPKSAETIIKGGGAVEQVFFYTFAGLLFFFIIEGILFRLHHYHAGAEEHPCAKKETPGIGRAPLLIMLGDSLHNFIDGVAIAAAFLVNIPLGITTTIAIASHEIPQEIGDFSIMLHAGWRKRQVLFWNLISALATTVGAVAAFIFRVQLEPILGYLLAFAAGLFIYIATADLMPELYHSSQKDGIVRTIIIFLGGVLTIFLLTTVSGA